MREVVTLRDIQAVFSITDRLGIHRESLVIPLATAHPGRVRRRPDGKIEIVVEAEGVLDEWLAGLETRLREWVRPD